MPPLQSMTGFARAESGDGAFVWELRSVNGKGLDTRFRLPPGFERIEQAARLAVQARFSRGNLQATLSVARATGPARPVLNERLLAELAAVARRLETEFGLASPTADGLLALRGVLEPADGSLDEDARMSADKAALAALEDALDDLTAARRTEGEKLGALLLGHVDTIETLTARAAADPSRETAAIRERLREQVALLLEASSSFDEARLHAEAAFLATKADIREEIDRLVGHVAAARELLGTGGAVGRRLDFLAQEFNREANTLCSKSNAASVTALGLDLKVAVDQFREQVQNLE